MQKHFDHIRELSKDPSRLDEALAYIAGLTEEEQRGVRLWSKREADQHHGSEQTHAKLAALAEEVADIMEKHSAGNPDVTMEEIWPLLGPDERRVVTQFAEESRNAGYA